MTFRANELPAEFAARPVDRVDQVDLSRLNSHTVRSDQIGPGDLLDVTVISGYGDSQPFPMPVRVSDEGVANVPLIGKVQVAGLTLDGASRVIGEVARHRDVYRTPYVTVVMKKPHTNRVIVSGAVKEPKVVDLPRGNSTVLAAITEAGGFADDAGPEVSIRRPAMSSAFPDTLRGNPLRLADGSDGSSLASYDETAGEQARTVQINLVSATTEGKGGYNLDDGDIVHVKKRPERTISVTGLVTSPGEFEMPPNNDLYLINAVALAGGRRLQTADRVAVIRRIPGRQEPIRIQASLQDAKNGVGNVLLQENDVVDVEETPVTIAFETLKTFFRFSIGSSVPIF